MTNFKKKLFVARVVEQQAGEITRLLAEIEVHAIYSYHVRFLSG
jgi:hypothetical protein